MRRWDGLVDRYLEECERRGLAPGSRERIRSGVMRGMGEFLVREGAWRSNPLRWLKGPRVDARSRVPRRIGAEQMERLWVAAATQRSAYACQLWTTVLAVLYGTALRRGELERLELTSYDRVAGVLELDGRKTQSVRRVPVPELVARCLEAYLPLRQLELERMGRVGEPALFVSRRVSASPKRCTKVTAPHWKLRRRPKRSLARRRSEAKTLPRKHPRTWLASVASQASR